MKSNFEIFVCLFLLCFVQQSLATCGQCGMYGVACISRNTFSFCNNGIIQSNSTNACPSLTVCTNSPNICGSASTFSADCPNTCGVCSLDNRYACVNTTTYALCFGTRMPSSVMNSCPTGQVCDTSATPPAFCTADATRACLATTSSPNTTATTTAPLTTTAVLTTSVPNVTTSIASTTASTITTTASATTTTASTISTTSSTITTTAIPTTTTLAPNAYCQQLNARDKTRYAVSYKSNCKDYVYCFRNRGALSGSVYHCPGLTLFNNATGLCVPPSNYTCPANM